MKRKVSLLLTFVLSAVLVSGCLLPKVTSTVPGPRDSVTVGTSTANPGTAPYAIKLGIVYVDDFYPGAFVDTLTKDDESEAKLYKEGDPTGVIIVNNLNEARRYRVVCIQPGELEPGFDRAPDYVLKEWVRISDPSPILVAKEMRLIPVSLWMPLDAEVFADKWEFYIGVIDLDQPGTSGPVNVLDAYASRWLVTMRK